MSKLLELERIATERDAARTIGKHFALVLGVFDLIHAGHVQLLQTARSAADFVVVGIYDDASSRVLTGPGRPLMPLAERIEIVSSFEAVRFVVALDSPEPAELIEELRPDIFVFGGDGPGEAQHAEAIKRVREYGGVALSQNIETGSSATAVLQRMFDGVDVPLHVANGQTTAPRNLSGHQSVVSFPYMNLTRRGASRATSSRMVTLRGRTEHDLILDAIREGQCFYEDFALRELHLMAPHDGVVVDVGANIGNHSVFFGAYMAEKVVAIEPVPELFELLTENIASNALENIVPIRVAVGREEGLGRVYFPPDSVNNAGAIQIRPLRSNDSRSANAVRIRPLDHVLADCAPAIGDRPITLLKIDVEGSEYAVLLGAAETIRNHRPLIYIELANASAFNAVAGTLNKLGYQAVRRYSDVIPSYIFAPGRRLSVETT